MDLRTRRYRQFPLAYRILKIFTLFTLCIPASLLENKEIKDIQIGTIFPEETIADQEHFAFRHAIHQIVLNNSEYYYLGSTIERLDTLDSYSVSNGICSQLERGVLVLFGIINDLTVNTFNSFSNTFKIPLITPSYFSSEKVASLVNYNILLHPSMSEVLVDLIKEYKWKEISYLYDDDSGLYRLQSLSASLLKEDKLKYPKIVGHNMNGRPVVRDLLDKVREMGSHRIIIDAQGKRAEVILKQALQRGMMSISFHYVVLDFDITKLELEEYIWGGANLTGFNLINENSPHFQDLSFWWNYIEESKYKAAPKITLLSTLIYDAVLVLAEALKNMTIQGFEFNQEKLSCDKKETAKDGERIVEKMKTIVMEGLTGSIEFDKLGMRKNYKLDIYERRTRDTISEFTKVGVWDHRKRALNISVPNPFPEKANITGKFDISNRTLRITTIEAPPYFMNKSSSGSEMLTGNERFEGYCVDLAMKLAEKVGFKYTFNVVKDGNYGGIDDEGNWNGMVGELIRDEADLAIAPLTITSIREKHIDFSKPFMNLGVSIMILKPQETKPGVFSFLHPLSYEIWMCIVFAYVGVSVVLFLVSRFSPYEWHSVDTASIYDEDEDGQPIKINDFGIFNSLWFSLGAFMQQGSDICPRSLSGRIVGGVWWFFTLIIISSYTANLAAFLTVERMVSPINSADDLASQTEISYGCLDSSSTKTFFQNSHIVTFQKMWGFMEAFQPNVFVKTTEEGVKRVRDSKGKYAFLVESTMNEYHNQKKPCDTMKVGSNLDSKGYGVGLPKNSPLKDDITLAVLRLREDSELDALKTKWWIDKGECGVSDSSSEGTASALSLSNVAGVFYILVGGLGIAMITAMMEFCYKSQKDSVKSKTPLTVAMRAKARMSVRGENGYLVPCSSEDLTKSLSTVPIAKSQGLSFEDLDTCSTNTHTQV